MRALIFCSLVVLTPLAHAGGQPAFWLSYCAWQATDVLELPVAPGEGRFRVVATIKGGARAGEIKILPELAPPAGNRSLLKDLASVAGPRIYETAPPIREADRLIVFLQPGNKPANFTMLTSAIWLQDGVVYVFDNNPASTHLVTLDWAVEVDRNGNGTVLPSPTKNEAAMRADIRRLLQFRQRFDDAIADPNPESRTTALARLVTSDDRVVIDGTLEKLRGEGTLAARALRPYLDDESALNEHFRILDTITLTDSRDMRLDSVIQDETTFWKLTCRQTLPEGWDRTYFEPPSAHYLRLLSALKAIRALGIRADLAAVREFESVMKQCDHLNQQLELRDLISTVR